MEIQNLNLNSDDGSNPIYPLTFSKQHYAVRPISHKDAVCLVTKYHYAHSASNTGTYCHGLFFLASNELVGSAIWLPPTKSAALATYRVDFTKVLALSRLVVKPGIPKNACSFFVSKSVKLIDQKRYPVLVTYADSWQKHIGTIYRAANWTFVGNTKPTEVYTKNGKMQGRKRGPKTFTHNQMLEQGFKFEGKYSKAKFILVR